MNLLPLDCKVLELVIMKVGIFTYPNARTIDSVVLKLFLFQLITA